MNQRIEQMSASLADDEPTERFCCFRGMNGMDMLRLVMILFGSAGMGLVNSFPGVLRTTGYLLDDSRMTTSTLIGFSSAVLGSIFGGGMRSFIGMRLSLAITAFWGVVGWSFMMMVRNEYECDYRYIFAARFFCGLLAGGVSVLNPVALVEMAPLDWVAVFGVMHQAGINFGRVFGYIIWIVPGVPVWIIPLGGLALSALSFFCVLFLPRIPLHKKTWGETCQKFWSKDNLKLMGIVLVLSAIQQAVGINVVVTQPDFAGTRDKGPDPRDVIIGGLVAGVLQLIGTGVCTATLNSLGRRRLWFWSGLGVCVGCVLIALLAGHGNAWPLVGSAAFLFSFGLGLGPLLWLISAEVFPRSLKLQGVSASAIVNWCLAAVVVFISDYFVEDATNPGTGMKISYLSFGVLAILGAFFGLFFIPELEAMDPGQESTVQKELLPPLSRGSVIPP